MERPDLFVPSSYLPILIMLVVALVFGLGGLIFGALVRPKYYYSVKLIPYECGNEPSGLPWQKITIRYFPIAILFAVFDVEVGLLYAWCYGFSGLKTTGFLSMLYFLLIILVGLFYDLKKGLLDWQRNL
ncbi:MAG: NADH-quinone oxidoreductase subunit A [Caldimicrobium thiodismutans]|uniref:NADH-quinone oxidoreductase subunit n=1 Tax=Caldimicrobium thiodismutans TaxID=1653476 RepID=A0A2N7PLD0_9BACT|nr:MAG: NADH-quinone oxidoreductase subunit A [Caldimicrobium thiodismutans]